jgi:N-acetyl-anhydromuramyl-L-alanine amidase AmpD
MIAYNYIITPDGKIYDGRPVGYVPAAAYGRNLQSLNVVLVGNFEKGDGGFTGPPTAAQYSSLVDLSVFVHQHFPSILRTIGHRDVATEFYPGVDEGDYSTACPGSELYSLLPAVRAAVTATFSKR